MKRIAKGIYPTMITPYRADGKIDWDAVDHIVEFYVESGCQGVFAVCQSSEMFYLTEDERVELARRVVRAAAGRLCVVASGHVSDGMEDQLRELGRMQETGVDAVVLVSNRLATAEEDDSVWLERMERILTELTEGAFGVYECPYPYKRLLSERVLRAMAESGRFAFIKDTCCDAELIAQRLKILDGRVQLFNANTATLLDTLRAGADGFSGVMGNLHPDLYVWLEHNYREQPEKALKLQAFLTLASGIERGLYPTCAKYHMNKSGRAMSIACRHQDAARFTPLLQREIDDLMTLEQAVRQLL